MGDLANRKYIRWNAEGVEKIPPNEEQDINDVASLINEIQKTFYNQHRYCTTGTHARTQGIVKGKFIVKGDLPPHLKQTELFQSAGEYDAACRYSTEVSDVGIDDRVAQPRGFSMKLFGLHGDMFEHGQNFSTQDIELNNVPIIELADAKTTKEILQLRLKHGYPSDKGRETIREDLKKRDDYELQIGRDEVKNTHLESMEQYSQSAYRFGDYVCKYRLIPDTDTQRHLGEELTKEEHGSDILSRWLASFHSNHEARYLFQVQLLENLDEQSVEYAGTEWDAEKYPFQTVAQLVIPTQNSFQFDRVAFWQDSMKLDPWHGLKSFQPLGSANRLRRAVYPASRKLRREINAKKEVNVRSIDDIP